MTKTAAPTLSPEEAAAMREQLAAFDTAERAKENAVALAPLQPLVGVLDGQALRDIVAKVAEARPGITDKRLLVHLDGFLQITPTLQDLFGQVVASYQAEAASAA